VRVANGVLNARPGASGAPLTLRGPKPVIAGALVARGSVEALERAGHLAVDGDRGVLETYGSLIDSFDPNFAVVTP